MEKRHNASVEFLFGQLSVVYVLITSCTCFRDMSKTKANARLEEGPDQGYKHKKNYGLFTANSKDSFL